MRTATSGHHKRHLVFVDGIIAGQGRGPMNPDPMYAGLILSLGTNAASTDAACAILMGYDPERIPIIRQAFCCRQYPLADWNWSDIELDGTRRIGMARLPSVGIHSTFHFEPHFGWKGHIERSQTGASGVSLDAIVRAGIR